MILLGWITVQLLLLGYVSWLQPAIVVIGNEATGTWTRLYGEASVPMVLESLEAIAGLPDSAPSGGRQ